MRRGSFALIVTLVVSGFAPSHGSGEPAVALAQAGSRTATAANGDVALHRVTIEKYCVTCHNARLKTGGLSLDAADLFA